MNEKEVHFQNRTEKHILLVQNWVEKIEKTFPELKGLVENCKSHDASKYEEPEYTPYLEVNWHYKCKAEGIDYPLNEDAHLATFHHIKNNSHHPEFHDENATLECLNSKDGDRPSNYMVDTTSMPKIDIAEMVSDWMAIASERKTNPYAWAKNNINIRWKFTKEQEELIYSILDKCWEI